MQSGMQNCIKVKRFCISASGHEPKYIPHPQDCLGGPCPSQMGYASPAPQAYMEVQEVTELEKKMIEEDLEDIVLKIGKGLRRINIKNLDHIPIFYKLIPGRVEEPPLGYKYAASELKKLYNSLKVGQQIKLRDFLAGGGRRA